MLPKEDWLPVSGGSICDPEVEYIWHACLKYCRSNILVSHGFSGVDVSSGKEEMNCSARNY